MMIPFALLLDLLARALSISKKSRLKAIDMVIRQ